MGVRLIVGLGNPGKEYSETRHNTGAYIIDKFCGYCNGIWKKEDKLKSNIALIKKGSANIVLAKPETYVNDSGEAVQKICHFYKILSQNVVVICDDISFELGEFKITLRSGTAGHNGLIDILSKIGPGFVRFRIGVGAKKNKEIDLKDHVLGHFTDNEKHMINKMIPEILNDLQLLLDKGVEYSMNLTNRKKNYGKQEELQG